MLNLRKVSIYSGHLGNFLQLQSFFGIFFYFFRKIAIFARLKSSTGSIYDKSLDLRSSEQFFVAKFDFKW